MNNKNIFLIGMMGSGKSTVGPLLSSKIKIPFFDMDNELEKLIDMSINEIFTNYGESRFRLIESTFFNENITNGYAFNGFLTKIKTDSFDYFKFLETENRIISLSLIHI